MTRNNKGDFKPGHWKGPEHPRWKGDKIDKGPLHLWIHYNKPKPDLCEECHNTPPTLVHNIPKTYTRNLDEWKWICYKCHSKVHKDTMKRPDVTGLHWKVPNRKKPTLTDEERQRRRDWAKINLEKYRCKRT